MTKLVSHSELLDKYIEVKDTLQREKFEAS